MKCRLSNWLFVRNVNNFTEMGIFRAIAGKTTSQETRRAHISASVDRLYLRKWGEKKIVCTGQMAIKSDL